jgi:hypothetical protein
VLRAALALRTLAFCSACQRRAGEPPITRDKYVEVYVQILRAGDEARDSFEAKIRAVEIMDLRDVTQQELLDFARFYADDPEYLVSVWQEIEDRLKAPVVADSAAAAGEDEPPPREEGG